MEKDTAELNSWTIALEIMRERHRRSFILPHYTPRRWWECDVFEITQAGYFVEYEIKMTISDFKRDPRKKKQDLAGHWKQLDFKSRTKHDLLSEGNVYGPSRFFFVTPPGLVATEHKELLDPLAVLPKWAGLIEVQGSGWQTQRTKIVVQAPRLHKEKVSSAVSTHARGICYYRMHDAFLREKG